MNSLRFCMLNRACKCPHAGCFETALGFHPSMSPSNRKGSWGFVGCIPMAGGERHILEPRFYLEGRNSGWQEHNALVEGYGQEMALSAASCSGRGYGQQLCSVQKEQSKGRQVASQMYDGVAKLLCTLNLRRAPWPQMVQCLALSQNYSYTCK